MGNIHLIPTPNPSRLYIINRISELDWSEGYLKHIDGGTNQNLYVTSDEKIKEGDYALNPSGKRLKIVSKNNEGNYETTLVKGHYFKLPKCKKIILTTDQELIEDGVQEIDDEFLEWFVKNPSCEEVEVIYGLYNPIGRKVSSEKVSENHSQCVWKYRHKTSNR